jgi:hypothetical protein
LIREKKKPNFKSSLSLVFFAPFELFLVPREAHMELKKKEAKLRPNFKFGARPKLGFFFASFEFLLVLIKA